MTDNVTQNELWQAFFTEVSEQLDSLELILSANDAESSADIHQLFRDFHTIKSSCAMMDFHSMEKIAHASEDYLDLVRKGRTTLNHTTIGDLLGGIDWLKSQLQLTRNTGKPPQENTALVEKLRQLSRDIAAIAPSGEKTAADEKTPQATREDDSDIRLSDDEIHEFASACTEEMVVGLTPGTEPAKIKRSLNKLVNICNLLGFTAISSLLKKYIKASNPLDQGRATAIAAEVLGRIISLENRYQVDCGTQSLRMSYLDAMFVDFAQLSGRLDYLLDLIEQNPDDTGIILECETLLQRLAVNAGLFGYSQLLVFFRYVLQAIRSIRRGNIPDRHAAFYAVRHAVDFPIAEHLQDGETEDVRKDLQARIAELNDSITQAMHAGNDESARRNLTDYLLITQETVDILMPESVNALDEAIRENRTLCEIDIDMDCPPEITDSIVSFISGNGTIIHNRSVFAGSTGKNDTRNCICFIVAAEKSIGSIADAIHNIDTERQFSAVRDIRKSTEKTVPVAEKKPASHIAETGQQAHAAATLRIESHTLENLMTQTGEMIMTHNALVHEINNPVLEQTINQAKKWLAETLDNKITVEELEKWRTMVGMLQTAHQTIMDRNARMQQSAADMQSRILDLRVIPVSSVFNRIPQLVRKMSETQGKKIRLAIEGKQVRIDKGMVDILMEPLIHLVRNCIDHGIETPEERRATGKPEEACLTLSASQEGSTLTLEISDNGRGINLPRIRESAIRKGFIQASDTLTDQETCKLIFLPGFSTADVITETSGRGVGMDVVITRINHIGGDIDVHTNPGHGTRFTMTLPLSAAIQGVIVAQAGNHTYAIAQGNVVEIVSIPDNAIQEITGQSVLVLRDTVIPLFRLDELALEQGKTATSHRNQALQFSSVRTGKGVTAIIVGQQKNRIGVCVDVIHGREDVFVRELHKDMRNLPSICGATARGNGDLVFILNSQFLVQYAQKSVLSWMHRFEEQAT